MNGAQRKCLGVMIGRCSLDSQYGGSDSMMRMLAVLFPVTQIILLSGTQTVNKSTTHTRCHSIEKGLGKITHLHYTVILEATLPKAGREKE